MANIRKNKDFNPYNCPVTHCMNKIGGKWKILIIYAISLNCNRFSKLQKALPVISKQILVNQLRELEEDGILERISYPQIPPKVEYRLTDNGLSLMPVI
jgi:DNA-binding HxlR family transcriptional regulator